MFEGSFLNAFGLSFLTIFVALDIIGVLPIYVSKTAHLPKAKRNEIADLSMAVAFVIAILFTFGGEKTFKILGITIYDFKIAGGLILLLVSLADLITSPDVVHRVSGSTGIVPLAVPMITGPGVVTTSILQGREVGYPVTVAALLANYLLAWILMRSSDRVTRLVGKDSTVVISKIAALLLAAIGISMMRSGVFDAVAQFRLQR